MVRGAAIILLLGVCLAAMPVIGRDKNQGQYGMGLIINVPLPEAEVSQVVADVAQNGIIRGTKEYNKDEYIKGAEAATASRLFPAWTEGGKVFYKVRKQALDPRNFKDSGDVGTLAVRYVVQPQGDQNTVLRIEAVFVEDFRKTTHLSNGSVESSEYKDIQEHLSSIELMKKQTIEAEQERVEQQTKRQTTGLQGELLQPAPSPPVGNSTTVPVAAEDAQRGSAPPAQLGQPRGQTLEAHVRELRSQVERLVKSPGAPLKAAPFRTATTLKALPAATEVLLVIATPYWYGVETRDGQHGWISRDQLEPLP